MSALDPLRTVREALEAAGCDPQGREWTFTARCPAHEDRSPSLSVAEGADRRALIHCHAGCRVENVLHALELSMTDLFPAGHRSGPRRPAVVAKAPRPAEALLAALDCIGADWSGLVSARCPYCSEPALWWRIRPDGVDADCPQGCTREEILRSLDCHVALAEAEQ